MDQLRSLEITLISAKGLQKVNLITKMDVYAAVEISGGPKGSKQKTHVDKDGDANPSWNFPMKFTVDESALQQNRLTLVVKLKSEGMLGDKEIGEVHVPVKELVDGAGKDTPVRFVSYQVRKPSGKPKGELYFSYKFGKAVTAAKKGGEEQPVTAYPMMDSKKGDQQPVTAYPMLGPSSGYPPPPQYQNSYPPAYGGAYPPPPPGGYYPPPSGYPPPPQSSGYAYQQQPPYGGYPPPPPGGYPYPPQQGYGYPPPQQVQQPKKKNKLGMGLGAGLLGGALGGLIIGDIVSDAADGGGCGGGCGGF